MHYAIPMPVVVVPMLPIARHQEVPTYAPMTPMVFAPTALTGGGWTRPYAFGGHPGGAQAAQAKR